MRNGIFKILAALALAFAVLALAGQAALAADRLRLAMQKTGAWSWELAVAQTFGLDKELGLELDLRELANTEAGKVAIQGGAADMIVSDWLWVARERAQGGKLVFYPHSTAIGAVMTRNPAIASAADLQGRTVGVAGGPLDKSWLFLKAAALKEGVDLEKSATIIYGAPPLLAEKAAQGELDAVLEFWTFCADLEARGFRRAIEMTDIEKKLGAKAEPVVTGYVFDESFAKGREDVLKRFFAMMRKAEQLIATSDEAWRVAAKRLGARDETALALYRKRYVQGIPARNIAEEKEDAARLYAALATIGGEKLTGPAKTLDPGTFYANGEQP